MTPSSGNPRLNELGGMNPVENSQTPDRGPTKKPYSKPRLEVYGTLHDIAQAVGNAGNADGGSGNPNHQHTR
jgi:hypothetical protein